MELLLVGIVAFFWSVTLYHTALIFVGLRLTRRPRALFDKGSLRNPVDLPTVSIVIPAKDEEVVIDGAVRCADRLQYPKDLLEILVVEDGSSDETPTIGKRLASALPNVVCISGGASIGKPAALNRAIARARGEVVAIFDSDTRYESDLLLRIAKYFHDHPDVEIAQAFPNVMNANRNVITQINFYETRFWFQGLQAAKERYGLFMHLAGTGMFIRRRVLEELGPWDEGCLTEDLDYSMRLAMSGAKMGMADADVWIQPTYRAAHLVRQRRRWWGGALQVFGKALRIRFAVGRSVRQTVDAFIYLLSPIVFLLSSLIFFVSLAAFAISGGVFNAFSAWVYGLLGSNMLLVPLVVSEAIASRNRRLLLLIPGLYWYWILQMVALVSVAVQMILPGRRPIWQRTPKIRVD